MIVGDSELDLVRFALALHLGILPEEIHEHQALERDLGLDPLDLVLVVLRLEELNAEDTTIEFPVANLEGLLTVNDLTDVVRAWRYGPLSKRPTMIPQAPPPPPRPASGFHLIGSTDQEEEDDIDEAAPTRRMA